MNISRKTRAWSPARRAGLAAACLAVCGVASAELEVTGIDEQLRANVLAHLDLGEEGCDAPQRRIMQEYQAAPDRIRSALEAFGYYAAKVAPELERGAECWTARFAIELGEPVRIRGLELVVDGEAHDDPAFAAAIERSRLKEGDPLNHGDYEQLKQAFSDLAIERGYSEAVFQAARIDVYPADLAADVTLRFDSGPRYRFGAIEFRQDALRERLVRAYLGFQAGDPYDNRQLTALYVALSDTGYFETVDVRPLTPDRETRRVSVSVTLQAAPARLITYGAGFSTDTGPRLRFGRTNRRRNDRGHQFGVNAQLSPVVSEVTTNYRLPYGNPRFEWISVDGGVKREDTDTSKSDSVEFGTRRVLESPNYWTRTQFLSLLIEDFEIGDQADRSKLLMPGTEWSRIRADNNIRPRRGSKLDFEIRGGVDALVSDTSFVQVVAGGKWIRSLPSSARIIVRGRAGATWEDSFQDLPPSVRFFAGGDDSVRGYGFESLGPMNADGRVIGGSALATASFEYEHPVRDRWSVAFFVDSGNAFTGSHFDPKTGAGIGARWQSPLGPIRIDVAFPLDEREKGPRLHVTLGPDL